jgi:hypothetical protein
MTVAATSSVATGLAGILSNLTPGEIFKLGHHLTSSDEAKALAILASMSSPPMATALVGSLASIPNLPPVVMTWVSQAIANPANFPFDMANAVSELQKAVSSPGILGSLGL